MNDTKTLQASDHAHYLHPFTDHKALGERGVRVMVRGEGIYLWDSDGKKILDGMSARISAFFAPRATAAVW